MTGVLDWRFPKKGPDEDASSDSGRNSFGSDGAGIPSLVRNLVRESVQNSMDKRVDQQIPVRVVFSIGELDSGAMDRLTAKYFAGLDEHVSASLPRAAELAGRTRRYLLIEDFNTTGLTGNPEETRIPKNWPDPDQQNNFYFFWRSRNVRAGHQSGGGGSWGIGKVTYYLASLQSTVVALSVPVSDGSSVPTLMGRALLEQHVIDGDEFKDVATGGRPRKGEASSVVFPVVDPDALDEFRSDWGLARGGETGVSVLVPRVGEDFSVSELEKAVLSEYAIPLLRGDLVVEIRQGGSSRSILDKAELARVGAAASKDSEDRVARVIRLGQLLDEGAIKALPEWDPAQKLEDLLGEPLIEELREQFEAEGHVALRLPVKVTRENGTRTEATSDVEIVLSRGSGERVVHFVRSGLWISGEPGRGSGLSANEHTDVLMLVPRPEAAQVGSLSELLAIWEGPAHRQWVAAIDADRRRMPYEKADEVRKRIRKLPADLIKLIAVRSADESFGIGVDWFAIPDEGQAGGTPGKGKHGGVHDRGGGKRRKPQVVVTVGSVSGRPDAYLFKLRSGDARELRFRFGYSILGASRSKALSAWSPDDFEIARATRHSRRHHARTRGVDVTFSAKGVSKRGVTENELTLRGVSAQTFQLEIGGFGTDRAIVWDVRAFGPDGVELITSAESE